MTDSTSARVCDPLAVLLPGKRRTLVRPSIKFASSTMSSKKTGAHEGISEDRKVALKPASDVLAGALARAASQSTIHPLDTLKVRLQTASNNAVKGISKIGQLVPPQAGKKTLSGLTCHVCSLYKGVAGAASGAGIALGAYFACYGVATNILVQHTELPAPSVAFAAGGIAAAGSSVVKVPLAVCIRSVQAGVYSNVIEAATTITRAAGIRGLFTGFTPTMIEDVPDMAFKFAAYESMRQMHANLTGRKANPTEDFAMGAVSGAVAAAATTPLDVIKTNMMCNAGARPSMMSAAREVYANGGLKSFANGIGPRALSNGINSAVFFCFFEALRKVFAHKVKLSEQQAQVSRQEEIIFNAAKPHKALTALNVEDISLEDDGFDNRCEKFQLKLVGASVSLSTANLRTHAANQEV